MHDQPAEISEVDREGRTLLREWELPLLVLLVLAAYFTRLTVIPVRGEESRWANGAREMIASGDWIVPCQQGTIFPERPPLSSWAMAVVGLAVGEVDLLAIRLPSAIATLLTTLLIYVYARTWMSRFASFTAAVIFATNGQVLALGGFGESEAVFTLFTAGALLTWHLGYIRHWPPAVAWSLGYSLAALGALTKGPQAPIYFVLATSAFLLTVRDWRWLFGRGQLVGLGCFAAIVGAWMVPFGLSNPESIESIWIGLARDRFTAQGLLKHLASYPFDTLGCLLPWSPALVALVKPSVRRAALFGKSQALFVVVALAVTYPSVWLAAHARGRYYMPLYPCLAILMGLIIEHCTSKGVSLADHLMWRRYLRSLGAVAIAGAVVVVLADFLPDSRIADARQDLPFRILFVAASLLAAGLLVWASLGESFPRPQVAIVTAACFITVAYTGVVLNARARGANDLAGTIAELKRQLPQPDRLVSLRRVHHRFAYCYESPIRQIAWPTTAAELPADVTYFCFDLDPEFTDSANPGAPSSAPDSLPFAWDRIAEINCDPVKHKDPQITVVVGRVRRAEMLAEPSLSRPAPR